MKTTRFEIKSTALPPAFDGFTVAHVTDLHNRDFGNELAERVASVHPDIVAITGDSIHREKQTAAAEKFMRAAVEIAPVYYVTGNHEKVLTCYSEFEYFLRQCGVHVLANQYEILTREQQKIAVLGLHDPTYFADGKPGFCEKLTRLHAEIKEQGVPYTILLSHRPELFEKYAAEGIDLTLCGHAHGGHVRLPFIGAFYAPNQGLCPKYTEGVHAKEGKAMAISKGLGKSSWVPRVLNPPELCVEVLRSAQNE